MSDDFGGLVIGVNGLDRLLAKFGAYKPAVAAAIQGAALHVKGQIATYPPASEANNPANKRWYQRGTGSMYRRKDGTVKVYPTSKQLGKRWTIQAQAEGLRAVIGNNVPYSKYVQAAQFQVPYHARRGWKTDEAVAQKEASRVQFMVRDAILRVLGV